MFLHSWTLLDRGKRAGGGGEGGAPDNIIFQKSGVVVLGLIEDQILILGIAFTVKCFQNTILPIHRFSFIRFLYQCSPFMAIGNPQALLMGPWITEFLLRIYAV